MINQPLSRGSNHFFGKISRVPNDNRLAS